ncbi:MAG: hypothetical protein ACRD16_05070 [Thermoanaerobaculia bacterium]
MPTSSVLLRGAALALIVLPVAADSAHCRRAPVEMKASRKSVRVRITEDSASVAGCDALPEIDLSGAPEGPDSRDAILESVASRAGGNTVLVLKRTPQFIQARAFHCPDAGANRR